jgi:hypothetical protein
MKKWVNEQQTILEKEMIEAKAKEMQQEIDREVLWGMLKECGWHRVMIDRVTDNTHAIDITNWLAENVKNPYERNGRDFLFAAERDATMFILRWV